MAGPVLTLETLEPDRPTIVVDKVVYELALPDDFGLIEQARLARVMRQATEAETAAAALGDDEALSEADLARLGQLLDRTIAMIVRGPVGAPPGSGLPATVLERLNSTQKLQIIVAFDQAVRPRATSPEKPASPTSANSSPNSRRRTRGSRKTGTPCRCAN